MTDTTKRPPTTPQSIPQLTGRRLRLALIFAEVARRSGGVLVVTPRDERK